MKQMRPLIEEEFDRCLVTDQEWKDMLQNKLTQKVDKDPFEQSVPDDELEKEEEK